MEDYVKATVAFGESVYEQLLPRCAEYQEAAVAFGNSVYDQYKSYLQTHLPIEQIRATETKILQFFNEDIRDVDELPARAWPMTRLEV